MLCVCLQGLRPTVYMHEVEDDSEDSAETRAIEEAEAEALGAAASAAARAAAAKAARQRRAAAAAGSGVSSRTGAAAATATASSADNEPAAIGAMALNQEQLCQDQDCSTGLGDMQEDSGPALTLEPCLEFSLPDEVLAGLKVVQMTANSSRQAVENAAAAGPLSQQGRKGRAFWQQQLADMPVQRLEVVVAVMDRLQAETMSAGIIQSAIWANQ